MRSGRQRWFGLFLTATVLLSGCSVITGASTGDTPAGEGFAIYLTRDNVPVAQMEALSHVALADTPVIGPDDLVSYEWATHAMTLTPEAFARLKEMGTPVAGPVFVVCVDRQPVYWGAFWTMLSSMSFSGPVIMLTPFLNDTGTVVKIEFGYPGPAFAGGKDPRADPAIKAVLEAAGKLKV